MNYLSSVPLGRENNNDWSFSVEKVLVLKGLTTCINKTETDNTMGASLFVHGKDVKELWHRL